MIEHKTKTFFRRALKTALWFVVGILGLIILAVVALQFHGVQRIIAQKAVSILSEKTGSRIEIGSVSVAFTHSLVLNDIFVETKQRDTLLSVGSLAVDVNLFGLLSNEVILKNVRIDSLTTHITRNLPDSSFNFDFIINALSSDSTVVDTIVNTTNKSPWKIEVGEIHLSNIQGTYDDDVSGLKVQLHLGEMDASIDKFDLDKMRFYVKEVSLKNTVANVTQTKETPSDTSASEDIDIGVGNISLANIQFLYENIVTDEQYYADIGTSTLTAKKINLPSHQLLLKKFTLENTNIVIVQATKDSTIIEKPDTAAMLWVIGLDQLILNNNSAQYDIQGTVKTKGLDPNHLHVDGLAIRAEDIFFSEKRMTANIDHAFFQEHSGIVLRKLSGNIVIDSIHAQLTDFTIETPTSRIHQNTLLNFTSLSDLKNVSSSIGVKSTIDESYLAISDLLFFQPSLPIKDTLNGKIKISAKINGRVGDLQIREFNVSTASSTTIDLAGSIQGLPDANTAKFDVTLRGFSTNRKDIQEFVVDTLLPKAIVIPASLELSGHFNGSLKDFSASTIVRSSIGNIKADLELKSGKESKSTQWKISVVVEEFDLGSLLNDSSMFGAISLNANAVGTGLTGKDISAKVNITVDKALLNGYPYTNLSVEGTATPKMFEGKAEMKDSNIAFTFNGIVNTSKENPRYKFMLTVKGIDLHKLHFTEDDVRIAGIVSSDIAGKDINDFNGNADIRNVVIVKNNKRYTIDSLMYASVIIDDKTHISIESTILQAQFDGNITPGELPDVLKVHFSNYFKLDSVPRLQNIKPQAFSFRIALRDPSTLTDVFLPELHELSVGIIEGNFDSEKKDLHVHVDLPGINYSDIAIDSLTIGVSSDSNSLHAALKIGSISDSTFRITNLQLSGKVSHDSIEVSLQSTRNDGYIKMLLAGLFNSDPDGYRFRFNNDGVVFQNLRWSVPSDNFLLFGRKQLVINNIRMQGGIQSFSLNSSNEQGKRPPLKIEFKDFDIATLSQVIERDNGLFGGTLNGNIVLQNMEKQMAFTSDLKINGFSFKKMTLGDIALRANNQTENMYEVNMDISGNDNQIKMDGKYLSKVGGSELDLTLDFVKVNLASLEPFTFGNVTRLSGTMTGGLHITGTIKKPSIIGELNFTNAAFNPTIVDTYLRLNNGKIVIDNNGIELRTIDLIDTRGKTASVKGRLLTNDFRNYKYDLRVHTDNFLALNKPASHDALYYGTVILDSDISVKGDQKKQVVTIQAELDKGTNLALVLPESELAVEERHGIVQFVDKSIPDNLIMSRKVIGTNNDTSETNRSTMELTSNITVNRDTKLRILIDPVAGDSLVIQGEATLSFAIDPSGKITLTGRYDIVGGSYQLSFGDFIKRDFTLAQGSSLTWLGSPFDADVDITAIYTVKATVLDLIQNQLSGISQEERNKYKQEIPIQVYLIMKGKLLKPDIHFKLDLPPDKRGVLSGSVYAKLNELNGQESELNKQVFALLVLGRFVSENPLASAGGSDGLSDFARSSASQILSAQLNRLSEEYIKGVSLNMGLESYKDYSTGSAEGRTQLQVALSKQLFDERVTVQVGGNVDLEGQRSQKNSLNNFAGDLKVLYKLTEDGRWQLQVFRQNTYEGAIDGDITKTGTGVVFTVDYDKLFGFTLKPVPKQSSTK